MKNTLWTVKDLAKFLDKPTSWVYENHAREKVPSYRIGQQLRFRPHEIEQWLHEHRRLQVPRREGH
ncbi:helix-turn-helix domain-containing protein [Streptomyces triticirhizae]|uniref:DNA-binding protein n=1 Tax=Streptomyces triticirhizae TaxID=2483353 RepID=A0A3M2MBA5_9ACTN|nr:helix-turn-helix domain-containing protein [Streptomyces triticirhizae]RMI46756.1 DNA-binding protein [Streptomyces triticirhizae]